MSRQNNFQGRFQKQHNDRVKLRITRKTKENQTREKLKINNSGFYNELGKIYIVIVLNK